jgi:hypothetical protein
MTIISLKNAYLFPEKVGKKAFHLSLLLKQSFPVVDGYILCEPYSKEEIESLWLRVSSQSPLVVRFSLVGEDGEGYIGVGSDTIEIEVSKRVDFHAAIIDSFKVTPSDSSLTQVVLVQPMYPPVQDKLTNSAQGLNSDQMDQLAQLGKRIDDYLGVPQDIDWAIDREGKVVLCNLAPSAY